MSTDVEGAVPGVWQSGHRVHGEGRRWSDGVAPRTFSHTTLPPRDAGISAGHQRGIRHHAHIGRCVAFA